jgi:hydrogenase nickel incorporation protein HypB
LSGGEAVEIKVVRDILAANEMLARENRETFDKHGIFVVDLMSSPGAGKTSLLVRTLEQLTPRYPCAVVEGDITGDVDARRIAEVGVPSVQINTGGACHLDARMVKAALSSLSLDDIRVLFIENVGNLVCPANYRLGEDIRVTILSTPEGDDKLTKYPLAFRESDVLVINKTDLVEGIDFDIEQARQSALTVNAQLQIFQTSCRTGEGVDRWTDWLASQIESGRET